MRSLRIAAALSLFVLSCVTASLADTVTLTLTSANNYVSPDGGYVAPYYLQAAGSNQTFPVICDD